MPRTGDIGSDPKLGTEMGEDLGQAHPPRADLTGEVGRLIDNVPRSGCA
jgi:hypothetical protein